MRESSWWWNSCWDKCNLDGCIEGFTLLGLIAIISFCIITVWLYFFFKKHYSS